MLIISMIQKAIANDQISEEIAVGRMELKRIEVQSINKLVQFYRNKEWFDSMFNSTSWYFLSR